MLRKIIMYILFAPPVIIILLILLSLRGCCWQHFDRVSEWSYWEKDDVPLLEKDRDLEECGLTKTKFTEEERVQYMEIHSERERRNCPSTLWDKPMKGKWFRDRRYCTEITKETDQCMFSKGYEFIKYPDIEYYSSNSCQTNFRCENMDNISLPSCTQKNSWFGKLFN